MSRIIWGPEFSVFVESLDSQHQVLFDLLNSAQDAMLSGHGNEEIYKIMKGVVDYTLTHFNTEESYLAEINYPNIAHHMEEHNNLAKQAEFFLEKMKNSEPVAIATVLNFLQDWLLNHIRQEDKKYAEFKNSNEVAG